MPDAGFWTALDRLLGEAEVVIDRPKDNRHTRCATIARPLGDGYLYGISAADGGASGLWRGRTRRGGSRG